MTRPPASGWGLPELDARPAWRLAAFLLGYRGHTRRAYFADIRAWHSWCASISLAPLAARRHHVDRWIAEQLEEPLPGTGPAGRGRDSDTKAVAPVGVVRLRRGRRRPAGHLSDASGETPRVDHAAVVERVAGSFDKRPLFRSAARRAARMAQSVFRISRGTAQNHCDRCESDSLPGPARDALGC